MKPFSLKPLCTYFLALLLVGFAACEQDVDKPGNEPSPGEANIVTGVVHDTKGQPMAGVKVRAVNTASAGNTFVDGTTDNNGHYKLTLSSLGGWTMVAWKTVTTPDGDTYHLRMAGATDADYEPFTPGKNAVVRNFKWKLTGVIPDRPQAADFSSGYFGGSLRFVNDHYRDNSNAPTEMPVGT
ncbi:MAG: carboxypeptidase-like regulatory domain-containing protein, partial [Chitinophagaceae bacterium]